MALSKQQITNNKMSTFKSFDPPKFSKHSLYKKGGQAHGFASLGVKHKTLCSNCGYPYGNHFGFKSTTCPTKDNIDPKTIRPVKH